MLTEFASPVEYKIPIFLASGRTSLISLSCASTGSLSDIPLIPGRGFVSDSASFAATGSDTALKITGIF